MKKFESNAGLALAAGAVLLLSACAAAPVWQPPASHPTIAVTSVLSPYPALYVTGRTSTDGPPRPANIDFDVNRQIRDALHADLAGTGRYAVVDMDTDPGMFAVSKFTQLPPSILRHNSFFTLDPDLADILVTQAKGVGAAYVVAAVDMRYQHVDCGPALGCAVSLLDVFVPDSGWGLHHSIYKQCQPASIYLDYYVFVLDVDSGDTVASFETINDRIIGSLDIDHQDLADLPDAQTTEIETDLQDMVQRSVAAALTHLNLSSSNAATTSADMAPCATTAPAQAATGTSPK